jgi:hypothetical protein
MTTEFEFDAGYPPDVECVICLNPWTSPTELQPCGHVYCAACVDMVPVCPSCRGPIVSRKDTNRVLRNIVHSLPGKCVRCGWRGVRGQFLESHNRAACDIVLRSGVPTIPVPNHTSDAAAQADEEEALNQRQSSMEALSNPDSTAHFMAFFAAAGGPPTRGASADTTPNNVSIPHPAAAATPNRLSVPRPHSPSAPPTDDASSPNFGGEVSLAVAMIRGIDGSIPPLDYHTVSAPLDTCTGEAIMMELCPEIMLRSTPGGSLPVAIIVGDQVLASTEVPLSALSVQHGAVMYILTDGAEIDDRALEMFRVRSQLDDLVRRLRIAEASPRRGQTEEHPAADTELMRWGSELTSLLIRMDRLDNMPQALRQQRRRTCADAAQAEEMIDRLKVARGVRNTSLSSSNPGTLRNASFGAAQPAPSGAADQVAAMREEPWLMYNLSQRFYDGLLAAFATFDDAGRGVLNRQQITQVCRWVNLPSDATTIGDLFAMFCRATTSAAGERTLTFHQLCVWVQRHQRRPLHDYGLTFERYSEALDLAHAIDQDYSGGLTPSEAVTFLRRFAGKDATSANTLVESVIENTHAFMASTNEDGRQRSPMPETGVMEWAARRGEELALDIILRVLCSEAQGWDVCDVVATEPARPPVARAASSTAPQPRPAPAAAAPAPAAAAPVPTPTPQQRPRGATTSQLPPAARFNLAPSAPAAPTQTNSHHHRLRSATTTNAPRGAAASGKKDKCCVM